MRIHVSIKSADEVNDLECQISAQHWTMVDNHKGFGIVASRGPRGNSVVRCIMRVDPKSRLLGVEGVTDHPQEAPALSDLTLLAAIGSYDNGEISHLSSSSMPTLINPMFD